MRAPFSKLLRKIVGIEEKVNQEAQELFIQYHQRAEENINLKGYEQIPGLTKEESYRMVFLGEVANNLLDGIRNIQNPILSSEYDKVSKEIEQLRKKGINNLEKSQNA